MTVASPTLPPQAGDRIQRRSPHRRSGPGPSGPGHTRRVRHEVRDGLAVIAFTFTASTLAALTLLAAVTLVGRNV